MSGRFGVHSVVTLYERNTQNLSFNKFILLAAAFILFPFLEFIYAGFVCFTYSYEFVPFSQLTTSLSFT